MNRRQYLCTAAVGAVAGCLDPTDEPEGDSGDESPEEPSEEEPPEEQLETNRSTDEDPEPEAETEELTESQQRAQNRIEQADELLGEALEGYAENSSGDSILEVRASTTSFSWVPVGQLVREANDLLDRAATWATQDQQRRISSLRNVGAFIRESARTQSQLGETFESLDEVLVAHQDDTLSTVLWRQFQEQVEMTTQRIEEVRDLRDPDAAAHSSYLSVEQYQEKIAQFDAEHSAFKQVADVQQPFLTGHQAWIDAERAYRNRRWSAARNHFATARQQFTTAADQLTGEPVGDEQFDRRYQGFARFAETLADTSAAYEASSDAYQKWTLGQNRDANREAGDEHRRAGRRILRNEDTITDVPSVRRLEDYQGPN